MYDRDQSIREELSKFNQELTKKYASFFKLEAGDFRSFIEDNIGPIVRIDKPSREALEEISRAGGIVGVDGSVNRKGGAFPHYVEVFRGLAKSTNSDLEAIFKTRISSPLLSEEDLEEGEDSDKRGEYLAAIELEVALEALEKLKPQVIIMDGSLLRYSIDSKELWEELRYECEKKKVCLIGVIEDTKTKIIGNRMRELDMTESLGYDKELLFGRLEVGEAILIRDRISGKVDLGEISSLFMRTSLSPDIIGMDILDTQRRSLVDMASLVYGLTPENSRGIPLWLDIVDREVKISSKMLEALLKTYLDRKIYERLFVETRSKRS